MAAPMDEARRSPLRFLAPIALVAFLFAFFLVVGSADVSDDGGSNEAGKQAEQRDLEGDEPTPREEREEREEQLPQEVYIVKEGDNLGSIAEKTGLTVEELQELNPEVDPQALVTGQKIKLKE